MGRSRKHLGIFMISLLAVSLLVILFLYLDVRIDYFSLLKERIDYNQDKYDVLDKLKDIEKDIDLVRSRLDRYETLKSGSAKKIEDRPKKSSMLLFKPSEFMRSAIDMLEDYKEGTGLLTSRLSYLSTRGFFRDIPSIWPAAGWITSAYGMRTHPIYDRWMFHRGIDIANAIRTPVLATASGTVKFTGDMNGYGRTIVVDHGNGFETQYSHLSLIYVGKGNIVGKGDIIARMGNSGLSTGPHIHYEVRSDGSTIDPLEFIF